MCNFFNDLLIKGGGGQLTVHAADFTTIPWRTNAWLPVYMKKRNRSPESAPSYAFANSAKAQDSILPELHHFKHYQMNKALWTLKSNKSGATLSGNYVSRRNIPLATPKCIQFSASELNPTRGTTHQSNWRWTSEFMLYCLLLKLRIRTSASRVRLRMWNGEPREQEDNIFYFPLNCRWCWIHIVLGRKMKSPAYCTLANPHLCKQSKAVGSVDLLLSAWGRCLGKK